MTDIWDGIDLDFAARDKALITDCATDGIEMRPIFGIRHPLVQGTLWRQSRSTAEVNAQIASMRGQHCDYLADCIEKAGPHTGPWATNAMPGLSWHQYGEAMDHAWIVNGQIEWSESKLVNGKNGYQVLMAKAQRHNLTAIGLTMHKDFGHIQKSPHGSPTAQFTILQINNLMKAKFAPNA